MTRRPWLHRALTWVGLHSWWRNPIAYGPEFGVVVYECRWCGRTRYDRMTPDPNSVKEGERG